MLKFFSFCCLIGKNSEQDLLYALNTLLKSLDYYVKDYQFILYTNFSININHKNLIIRNYYDNTVNKLYNESEMGMWGVWLNLSFNKINIYKDLYNEFNENYIWTDLDLIIAHDISYIDTIDNFFVEHGGNCLEPHYIIKDHYYIPENRHIQGAMWKLNIILYNKLMETLNDLNIKNLKLIYDTQSLFAYYIYNLLEGRVDENSINVLGYNYNPHTINGLGIWDNNINTFKHVNVEGFNNLYKENNIIRTKYYPDKEIHILMFTFNSFIENDYNYKLKELFEFLN